MVKGSEEAVGKPRSRLVVVEKGESRDQMELQVEVGAAYRWGQEPIPSYSCVATVAHTEKKVHV